MLGVDGAETMLDKARTATRIAVSSKGIFDLDSVGGTGSDYSNAALHWVTNHETLFPRLLACWRQEACWRCKCRRCTTPRFARCKTKSHAKAHGRVTSTMPDSPRAPARRAYYDMIRPRVVSLNIWQTTYLHVLTGEDAVTEWAAEVVSAIPRRASAGSEGGIPRRLFGGVAATLSAAAGRHDAAAIQAFIFVARI